jgi:hypothetical protein
MNVGVFATYSEIPIKKFYDPDLFINLKVARFDPLSESPDIQRNLIYSKENDYYLVQCTGPIQSEWVEKFEDLGATILGYIPEYTYLLHMAPEVKNSIEEQTFVRWIGIYHPAYKLEPDLLSKHGQVQINVQVFHTNPKLHNFWFVKDQLQELGGKILREEHDVNTIVAELDAGILDDVAFIPEVEWIDEYSPPKPLMDNIRVFTGASSPLHEVGFNGSGIVGEVKDSGLDQDHPEFEGQLLATDGSVDEDSHGTSTFGIVFAKGVNDRAKGMLPGGQGVFATWGVGRKQSIANLVNNWGGVFQSNSWSSGSMDGSYGSNTRQNDEAVFDYDVTMLYATGNGGSEEAISQEATGKNVIGVGAFNHYNNQLRTDDRHTGNQGNRGPTADGRIKPDVVGPYDSIYTTTSGDRYTSGFGGTSGATPVAAGAVGLIYEMYRENHFRNNPSGSMPHASTVKAILIADAYQYEFSQGGRFAQGWGLVDVGNVYNIGKNHLIDDENNALRTGETVSYKITPTRASPLKISLVWTDFPGTTSSAQHLVNNLNLKVTDPNDVVYFGNYGLESSKWSEAGGEVDSLNNVENVFIENPIPGEWTIEVIGENIPRDGAPGTPRVDQSFALVASGVTKYEHDLRVQSLGHPTFVGVDEMVPINSSILNIGSNNEFNATVELLVDNITVDTTIVNSIEIGEMVETNFIWVPKEAGKHDISVYVRPLSGETSIWDNRKNKVIIANIITGKVLVDDGHGTDQNHNPYYNYIETMGPEKYRVHHTTQSITAGMLSMYDTFITARPTQAYSTEEIDNLETFVASGGGLMVIGEDDQSIYNELTGYAGITWGSAYLLQFQGETTEINSHEITENVSTLYFDSPQVPLSVSAPASEIVYTYGGTLYNRVTVAVANYGEGRMVVIADTDCLNSQYIDFVDNKLFGENIIRWLVNERPVAIISSPMNNSEYMMTDPIQFDGSTSYDSDGDVLRFLWTSNISGELGTSATFSRTLAPGKHTITLKVNDGSGKIGLAEIILRVLGIPTVDIRYPGNGSLIRGEVELTGDALDPDGTIENVNVRIDDGLWQMATDTSASGDWSSWKLEWDTAKVSDGNHAISVIALDNDGLNSSVDRISVVVDNTPPSITGPDVSEITDTEATIEWATDEPSDGILEYGTDLSYGFSKIESSFVTKHSFDLTDLSPKTTYYYKIISNDLAGNSIILSSGLTFETEFPPDFTPPAVEITSPENFEILAGEVLITADVTDNYGIAKVEFYIDEKLKFTDETVEYSWLWDTTAGNLADGEYTIRLRAMDMIGNVGTDEITVILDNEVIIPSFVFKRVTPNTVISGEFTEVLFSVKVIDPENRLESITIDLSAIGESYNQKLYDDGSHGDSVVGDNVYSFAATVYSGTTEGEKSLEVTVTYGDGLTTRGSIRLSVTPPTPSEDPETISLELPDQWMLYVLFGLAIIALIVLGVWSWVNKRSRTEQPTEVLPLEQIEYYPDDYDL